MITKRLLFLFCIVSMVQGALAQQRMDEAFLQPPTEAKPIMIWQWMDGLVSAEGITADLEAPRRASAGCSSFWWEAPCRCLYATRPTPSAPTRGDG